MRISSSQIQNVIKAYGQRIGRKNLARLKLGGSERASPDKINISAEARRKQLLHDIAANVMNIPKNRGGYEDIDQDIIEKISARFGEQIDIIPQENKKSGFKFKVLTKDNKETIRELSFGDLKKMVENLYKEDGEGK